MNAGEITISILIVVLIVAAIIYISVKGQRQSIVITSDNRSNISVQVEVANNPITRSKGLMGRSNLPENDGMLFIFDNPGRYGFWMMNTSIPLDAIFFSDNGTVVDIISMDPCGIMNCRTYTPKEDAKYVLEVNQGFSRTNNIKIGISRLIR